MAMIHISRGRNESGHVFREDVREGLRHRSPSWRAILLARRKANWQPLSQFPELGGAGSTRAATTSGPPSEAAAAQWSAVGSAPGKRLVQRRLLETLQMVLSNGRRITAMNARAAWASPLYAIIGGTFAQSCRDLQFCSSKFCAASDSKRSFRASS